MSFVCFPKVLGWIRLGFLSSFIKVQNPNQNLIQTPQPQPGTDHHCPTGDEIVEAFEKQSSTNGNDILDAVLTHNQQSSNPFRKLRSTWLNMLILLRKAVLFNVNALTTQQINDNFAVDFMVGAGADNAGKKTVQGAFRAHWQF